MLVTAIIVSVIIIATIAFVTTKWHSDNVAPMKKVCERNPQERYAQKCSTYDDCVEKCTTRLYDQSKE